LNLESGKILHLALSATRVLTQTAELDNVALLPGLGIIELVW
jgi:hypothetical protein